MVNISLGAVRDWLSTRPVDEVYGDGVAECPVAAYLVAQGFQQVTVGAVTYAYAFSHDRPRPFKYLPLDTRLFIQKIVRVGGPFTPTTAIRLADDVLGTK